LRVSSPSAAAAPSRLPGSAAALAIAIVQMNLSIGIADQPNLGASRCWRIENSKFALWAAM
jgi:hypothetical protein